MIECIHKGKKIFFKIKYNGKKQEVKACSACEDIIKTSGICEVLS